MATTGLCSMSGMLWDALGCSGMLWDALGRSGTPVRAPWLGEVWPGGGLLEGCELGHAKMSLHTSGPSPRCSLPDTSPARHRELPLRRYRRASASSPVAPSFEKAPLLPPVSSARPRCYHCQCDGPPPRHSTVVGGKSIVGGTAGHGALAPENVHDLNQVQTKRNIRRRRRSSVSMQISEN
jgi:hypothetical protein